MSDTKEKEICMECGGTGIRTDFTPCPCGHHDIRVSERPEDQWYWHLPGVV